MTEPIKLYRGQFGHVSLLTVSSDLVTHAHAEAHIVIWIEGTAGEMTIGSNKITLGPAIAAGINSFEPHSHTFSADQPPGLFLAFYLKPEWLCRRLALAPGSTIFVNPRIYLDSWTRDRAAGLLNNLSDGAGDVMDYEVERLIDSLVEAARAGDSAAAPPHGMRDYRVRKAVELMKANICERICFDRVARSVGLSRPHFFALFKEQMKLTPNVYWNALRMEEALRQLQSSEDSLISVAYNLGFTSQGNFSRFFRDHAGVPPTAYRSAARAAA